MDPIEIKGMKFYARHGHFKTERVVGNHFEADVILETDCTRAAESDDLNDALNYQVVYDLVKEEMKITSHLLENVAKRILDSIYNRFPGTVHAKVKVSKMNPPMGGEIERVSVTLRK